MMNYIWAGLMVFAFIAAVFQGNMQELSNSVIQGGVDAVQLCLKLMGSICLWSGLMRIAERSGLTEIISRLLSPLLKVVFPKIKSSSPEAGAISMNVTANLLGLGNAATPLGLEAMKHLQTQNKDKQTATREMIAFVVLNSAAFHLIPSTVALLRQQFGAQNPLDIMPAAWLSSAAALTVGITLTKIFGMRGGRKNG